MSDVITALRKQFIEINMVDRTRARHQLRAPHRPRCPGGVDRPLSGRHGASCALGSSLITSHAQPNRLTPLGLHVLHLTASPSDRTTGIRSAPRSLRSHPHRTAWFPGLDAEEQYWTAERMAQAKPIDADRDAEPTRALSAPSSTAAADTPHAAHFDGLPMVGTFFFDGTPVGGAATYCTGSVVRSKAKSLVLTAGHCANGLNKATHRVFVPQYQHLRVPANQPWGLFEVDKVYKDPRYPDSGQTREAVSDLDFAFVTVAPNAKGAVEDVTGALTFTTSTSYDHNVTVIGYPSLSQDNSQHKAIRCDVPTRRLYGFRQMQMNCGGYYSGVSGGPWIRGTTPQPGRER